MSVVALERERRRARGDAQAVHLRTARSESPRQARRRRTRSPDPALRFWKGQDRHRWSRRAARPARRAGELLQRLRHGAHRSGYAPGDVLFADTWRSPRELGGHRRAYLGRRARVVIAKMADASSAGRVAAKWPDARREFVDQDAEREDIGPALVHAGAPAPVPVTCRRGCLHRRSPVEVSK